jgi:hypothetical protein
LIRWLVPVLLVTLPAKVARQRSWRNLARGMPGENVIYGQMNHFWCKMRPCQASEWTMGSYGHAFGGDDI